MDVQEKLIHGYLDVDGGKSPREKELEDRLARLEAFIGDKVPYPVADPETKAFEDEIDTAINASHICKAKGKYGHYDANCPRCRGLKAEKDAKSLVT